MNLESIPTRSPDVVGRQIEGEAVLVHPGRRRVQVLNRVGAAAWGLMDGRWTVAELAERIAAEHGAPAEQVQSDLLAFCDDLAQRGLITVAEAA
jgi:hypothetical protein